MTASIAGALPAPEGSHSEAAIDPGEARLLAMEAVARHNGFDLDRAQFRLGKGESIPSAASLVRWADEGGLTAKADIISWTYLLKLGRAHGQTAPVALLFTDGSAGVFVGSDEDRGLVWLRNPLAPGSDPIPVDQGRLARLWRGEAVLARRSRTQADGDHAFSLRWVMGLVGGQRGLMKDVATASLTLSVIAIIPPLLVMSIVDRVVAHRSISTLVLLSAILAMATLYETVLGHARRELIQTVSARVDTRLNLHVFSRLLALPLDYFERHPAGQTTFRLMQVMKVREFVTGRLMTTFLDSVTLIFLLPLLFWMNATLAWMVLAATSLIAVVIMCFLPSIGRKMGQVQLAESAKSSVLVETVQGIRTVKSLALETQRKEEWDTKVATAGELRRDVGRLANWPQTLVTPLERFIDRGIIMIGAYLALQEGGSVGVGALVAFMMLGSRVTQPLVGLARLIDDFQDVRAAVAQVGSVLNNPVEQQGAEGLRPTFQGRVTFEGLSFTYPFGKTPALDNISCDIPAGTMVGVVGRSGSGKSTLTRLLQGINRDYSGFLKLDGAELREVNLAHLRRSFGVVLQDNFLFRGTVRDNISAGRPGLTFTDVIAAARLAGAEEFIERLPQGYDTVIEEGSPNLSGGQKQRLAIARALITDPRLLILDEATSALDPESEALVNANLTRIARNRTMIIVSHRLSSLVSCDLIMVMDKGRLVDMAPHATLLERCSIYRTLWNQQNRHLDPSAGKVVPASIVANRRIG